MLHYTIFNQSKSTNTPWLIFLAGYTGSHETWTSLCNLLLENSNFSDASILLIDNLGVGKSPQPKIAYTTELMAQEVIKVIDSLKIEQIILVGHSLGGAIAQKISLSKPEIVQHLFLISSFAKLNTVARLSLTSRYEMIKHGVDKRIISLSAVPTIFANDFLSNPLNTELAMQRMITNTQTEAGMFGQLNACLEHDTQKIIEKINCRTSIITGADDTLVHPTHSIYLHTKIQNSTLNYISNASHMLQIEKTKELSATITNLITGMI